MKTKSFKYIGIVLAVLLLFAVGPVQGQEPEPLPEEDPDGTEYILAQPPYTMNYQGYLTDSSGNPLNGAHDLAFQLWDDVSGGTMEWGTESHNSTQVTNGIFQVTLGSSVTLYPHVFDEALFLAVQVNGTWVTPRQPLHAVPYAFGLVPGAEVEGDPDGSSYGLTVRNTGSGPNEVGIYAQGELYGIQAESGAGDVGIYSPDFVHAEGYKSSQDSYLWVPGVAGVTDSPGCTLFPSWFGAAWLECTIASPIVYVYIPITIPAVLYGQEVRVENIEVYYKLENTASYIAHTLLRKQTAAWSAESLIEDYTPRMSTSESSYSLNTTGNNTLTASSGALVLQLRIDHDGDWNHDVIIGGVRVRLGHTD